MTDQYPERAGFTEHDTSKDAADAIEASGRGPRLRNEVLRVLKLDSVCRLYGDHWRIGITADELAAEMGESVLSVRPRVAELHKQGLIKPSGERRKSSGGRPSHVWVLV
jgi:response regulator of citrate/malate metabolism